MIDYKEKFEKMRAAGKLAAQTLDMLTDNIKEGISTDHIDKLGYEFIRDNGGYSAPLYYRGYTKSLCTSINHVVCHGIPSDRILREGDGHRSVRTCTNELFSPPKYRCPMLMILDLNVDNMSRCLLPQIHLNQT